MIIRSTLQEKICHITSFNRIVKVDASKIIGGLVYRAGRTIYFL